MLMGEGGGDGEGGRAAVIEDVGDCTSVGCGGGWELDPVRTAGRDIGESDPRDAE